ncbi:hypothetical protein GCM10009725_06370 [Aeromicrobium tamlense]
MRGSIISTMAAGSVLLAAVLAGCSGASEPDGPTVIVVGDVVPVLSEDDYRVTGSIAAQLDGRAATFQGWTAGGDEIYVREAHSADGGSGYDPYAVALVARDPGTGGTEVLSDRARRQGPVDRDAIPGSALQLGPVTVDGDRLLWVESPSRDHGDLHVLDLGDGTDRLLATRSVSVLSRPVVVGDDAWFIASDAKDPESIPRMSSLYRVPLDASAPPQRVAEGATDVFADVGGKVRVLIGDRLIGWDPSLGAEGRMPGDGLAGTSFAASEGVSAVLDPEAHEIRIDSDLGDHRIDAGDGSLGALNATDRWVAFAVERNGEQQAHLLDLRRGELRRLADAPVPSSARFEDHQYALGTASGRLPTTFPLIELGPAD